MKKILIVITVLLFSVNNSHSQKILKEEIIPLIESGKKKEALAALQEYHATAMSSSIQSYFLSGKLLYEVAIETKNIEDIDLALKDLNEVGKYWVYNETAFLSKKQIAAIMYDPEMDKVRAYQLMRNELDEKTRELRMLKKSITESDSVATQETSTESALFETEELQASTLSQEDQDKLTEEFWKVREYSRFTEILKQMPSLANSRNVYNIHALPYFISLGYEKKFIQTLVNNGADIQGNISDELMPQNAIAACVRSTSGTENDYLIAEMLLEKGSDPNAYKSLILLAKNRNPETEFTIMIAERLIAAGANVDAKDAYLKTALDYAKEKNKQGLIDLLSQ
ncbi:MAG: hypothetical protein QNK23_17885 [Crocinitomicaceae bacterium]|nr:hypothetical protein [Crocinitomicaceae bacterium]